MGHHVSILGVIIGQLLFSFTQTISFVLLQFLLWKMVKEYFVCFDVDNICLTIILGPLLWRLPGPWMDQNHPKRLLCWHGHSTQVPRLKHKKIMYQIEKCSYFPSHSRFCNFFTLSTIFLRFLVSIILGFGYALSSVFCIIFFFMAS